MNDMEKRIWASAFASAVSLASIDIGRSGAKPQPGVVPQMAASIADNTVQLYRAAMCGPEAKDLLPMKEEWEL